MCSSGCPKPGSHRTFGECLRSKRLEVGSERARQYVAKQNSVIEDYVDCRRAGMQPEAVTRKAVNQARQLSEVIGQPYRADV